MTVLQLPPRESFNILVSLLSLNGTKDPFLFLSPSALIQFANAKSDVLIFAPSISLIPLFSVTVPLSEPARSTSESLPQRTSCSVFLVLSLEANYIWQIAWDREDVKLAFVDSVDLLLLPATSKSITSFGSSTENSDTPQRQTPLYGSSRSSR